MRATYACGCVVSGLFTPGSCPLHAGKITAVEADELSRGHACPISMRAICAAPWQSGAPLCGPAPILDETG